MIYRIKYNKGLLNFTKIWNRKKVERSDNNYINIQKFKLFFIY